MFSNWPSKILLENKPLKNKLIIIEVNIGFRVVTKTPPLPAKPIWVALKKNCKIPKIGYWQECIRNLAYLF